MDCVEATLFEPYGARLAVAGVVRVAGSGRWLGVRGGAVFCAVAGGVVGGAGGDSDGAAALSHHVE